MSDAAARRIARRERDRAAGILYPLSDYAWCCLEDVAAHREIPADRVNGNTRNRLLLEGLVERGEIASRNPRRKRPIPVLRITRMGLRKLKERHPSRRVSTAHLGCASYPNCDLHPIGCRHSPLYDEADLPGWWE